MYSPLSLKPTVSTFTSLIRISLKGAGETKRSQFTTRLQLFSQLEVFIKKKKNVAYWLEHWACNQQVLGLAPIKVIGGDRKSIWS